jgi:hypothetical protein
MKLRCLLVALTLLVALAPDSWGQSQQPPPSAAQPNSQAQAKGKSDRQKASTDQRGTESAPLVVKIVGTEPQAQRAADTDRNGNKDNSTDWWMFGATVGIGLIGILQLAAFLVQARRLRQTVDIMKDTGERQLRAYISDVEGNAVLRDSTETEIDIEISFQNAGQTPAYNVEIRCDPPIIARHDARPFDREPQFAPVKTIIAPNSSFIIRRELFTDDAGVIPRIQNSERAIFVWGSVDYIDAFANKRYFIFRCIALGRGSSWPLLPHPDGYKAN